MADGRRGVGGLVLVLAVVVAQPASAQSAEFASGVKNHRLAAELGGFLVTKEDHPGVAFGAGYGYRPVSGLELGAGFRYFVRPAYTTEAWVAQESPALGGPELAPQHEVEKALHLWTLSAVARGYFSLDVQARFELGVAVRAGILGHDEQRGICCQELGLAPDFRARIAPSTALAFSPQLSLVRTGAERARDGVDSLFGYASVWLSVVQAF